MVHKMMAELCKASSSQGHAWSPVCLLVRLDEFQAILRAIAVSYQALSSWQHTLAAQVMQKRHTL